ncbi:hypothetical protein D3C71_1260550 [compost metagenome]
MEVPAKPLLVAKPGNADQHRVAVLVVGEELQRTGLAPQLVGRVVQVGQVLDLRDRQHAQVGQPLGHAQDHGFIQQRVEHPARPECLEQALADRVHPALLRHVLAEQQGRGILGHQLVQALVDLDRQVPWRQPLGQLGLAAEGGQARGRIGHPGGLGLHRRRRVRGQRRHDLRQGLELGPAVGFLGGGKAARAHRLVALQELGRPQPA